MEASKKSSYACSPLPRTFSQSKFKTKYHEMEYYRNHPDQFDQLARSAPEKAAAVVFDLGASAEGQLRALTRIASPVRADCCYRLAHFLGSRFSKETSEEGRWQLSQEILQLARAANHLGRSDWSTVACLLGAAERHFYVAKGSSLAVQHSSKNSITQAEAYIDILNAYENLLKEGYFNAADAAQLCNIVADRPTAAADRQHLRRLINLLNCRYFCNFVSDDTKQKITSLLETLKRSSV